MKNLLLGCLITVMVGCASITPQRQSQMELAWIKVLQTYKVEMQKCFQDGDILNGAYLDTCPIDAHDTVRMDKLIATYDLATRSGVPTDACSLVTIVTEAAVIANYNLNVNLPQLCTPTSSELGRILGE